MRGPGRKQRTWRCKHGPPHTAPSGVAPASSAALPAPGAPLPGAAVRGRGAAQGPGGRGLEAALFGWELGWSRRDVGVLAVSLPAPLSPHRLRSRGPSAGPSLGGEVMWEMPLEAPARSLGPACARGMEARIPSRRAGGKVERREGSPGRVGTSPGPCRAEEPG